MAEIDSPGPYAHWMLREIYEQPATLAATLGRYVRGDRLNPESCGKLQAWLKDAAVGILIVASGSSRHAGMAGELLLEDLSGIAVDVEYSSEYCYRPERALSDPAVMVISQSGETADTLAALRKANLAGHRTLAITNVEGSTMAREAMVSFPTLAGREQAIPATKSFTAQLLNLYLLSLMAAERRGVVDSSEVASLLAEAGRLPSLVAAQLETWEASARSVAEIYRSARSFLYLGRGVHYPIAREGALKLKESAYRHAEGYPSGELKHGPNALVGEGTPLVMIATVDRYSAESVQRYERVVSLMRDLRRQNAAIIAIANAGDETVERCATFTIPVAEASEPLQAICEVIPLQMIAYFIAANDGVDVDHPRNLAKAVLIE